MSARVLMRSLLLVGLVLLAGCGGAEDEVDDCDLLSSLIFGCSADESGSDDEPDRPPAIKISEPSGGSVTSAEQVRIAGTTSDGDAHIQWINSAGGSGSTSPDSDWCLSWCFEYDWTVVAPLAVGYNVITVVASNDGGSIETSISITRQYR
jgi:hypothetical protein